MAALIQKQLKFGKQTVCRRQSALISILKMTELCCLCLTEPKGYTIIEDENHEICQQIRNCLQLKLNLNDVKKAKICNFCLDQLSAAHGFFTRIHKVQLSESLKMQLILSPCEQEMKLIPVCQEKLILNNNCIESLEDSELDIKDEPLEDEPLEDEALDDEYAHITEESCNEDHFSYDSANSEDTTMPVNSLTTIKNWKSYPWYCYLCVYSTLNFATLMGHMKSKHNISSSKKMQFQCVDCTGKLSNYCNFLNHVRLEHQSDLKLCCDICSELFSDYSQLAKHRSQHKEKSDMQQPTVYHCNHCSKVYPSRQTINKHVLSHEQGLKCQMCGKCFKRLKYLKRHMEMHADLKHKCDFCDKTFHRKFNKINHERTHTGERPYKCNQCDKMFSFQSTLKSHQRTHTGELPYKCEQCSAKFRHSDSLKEHTRIHSKESPISCPECNATFQYRKSLHRHLRNIHDIKKPIKSQKSPQIKKHNSASSLKKPTKKSREKKIAKPL